MAKEFKLDLSKFKKVKSDKQSTTLRHVDGHELKVAHSALSPKMRAQMAELPQMMADGGDVGSDDSSSGPSSQDVQNAVQGQQPATQAPITINVGATPSAQPQVAPQAPQAQDQPFNMAGVGAPDIHAAPEAPPSNVIPQQPDATPPAQAPQAAKPAMPATGQTPGAPGAQPSQPVADPYGTEATYNAYGKGLAEQKAGLQGEANAIGRQGAAEAAALQTHVEQQQAQAKSYQDNYQALDKERQATQADIAAGHIDPNRLMGSMSTGQHVSTAIGLILGGIGSGLTGGPNMPLEFLKSKIAQDIDAQKTDLGRKENLLGANLRQFGNLRDATDMTRAMQQDVISSQLKMEAAKAQDPLAKSRALQAAGKLDYDSAQLQGQLAMRRTLVGGMNQGQIPPEHVVRMIVPQTEQAAAFKELAEAQETAKAKDNALSAFDRIAQLNTVGNRVMNPIQAGRQIQALKDPIVAQLSKATAGRFTEQDAGMLDSIFSKMGNSPETIAIARQQLNNLVTEKMNYPLLKAYGINAGALGRTNAQGQSRFQESAPVVK